MEIPTHRRDRTVYVNNISRMTSEDDLFTLFQRAGPIEKVIFKNVDGTPQHALIVFRRIESVMFCLENTDYFTLRGQQLGIRALRESQLTMRAKAPHSAGFERAKQDFFNFDRDYVQQFRQNSLDTEYNSAPMISPSPWQSLQETMSPFLAPPPTPAQRRSRRPPPLQIPNRGMAKQIWVPAEQPVPEPFSSSPFSAPPFSAPPCVGPSNHFIFPGQSPTLSQFPGMFDSSDKINAWLSMNSFAGKFDDLSGKK